MNAPFRSAEQALFQNRLIASLATRNPDGTVHLTAVWYLFENDYFYVATSSRTKKARNIAARPAVSLMIDSRNPGTERGVTVVGRADMLSGVDSRVINARLHHRYLSAAAIADPAVGPVFAAFDDVTIRIAPQTSFTWDMAELDAQAFGGRLGATPGYMLPLD